MLSLEEIKMVHDMIKDAQGIDGHKVIHFKIPTDKYGDNLMDIEMLNYFSETINEKLPEGITPIFSPFDVDLLIEK